MVSCVRARWIAAVVVLALSLPWIRLPLPEYSHSKDPVSPLHWTITLQSVPRFLCKILLDLLLYVATTVRERIEDHASLLALLGNSFEISKTKEEETGEKSIDFQAAFEGKQYVGLCFAANKEGDYFSCSAYQSLKEAYAQINKSGRIFEIVFVSDDLRHFRAADMPWLAVAEDRDGVFTRAALRRRLRIPVEKERKDPILALVNAEVSE